MKKFSIVSFVIPVATLLAMLAHPGIARATDRYVTDSFEIMVRSGPSLENKIVKVLRSGTKVNVVNADAGEGYSELTLDSGDTGYVLTRLLTPEPVARDRLAALQKTLEELQADPDSLQARFSQVQAENSEMQLENSEMSVRVQEMSEELARIQEASENAINNASERENLQLEVDQLTLEFDDLRLQNRAFRDQSDKKWFIVGALTLLGGIVVGLVIPSLRRKRQSSWSRY